MMVTVISDSVIPISLGSYMRIRYIRFQFWVITVSVISDTVILVYIISDSYLVISDSLYLIPLYQNPLYQIHCGQSPYWIKCRMHIGTNTQSCPSIGKFERGGFWTDSNHLLRVLLQSLLKLQFPTSFSPNRHLKLSIMNLGVPFYLPYQASR